MSLSKEEIMLSAKKALQKAQEKYDKAFAEWQDEVNQIVLKPIHTRSLSRKQAIKLAKILESDECFEQIMKMGLLPTQSTNEREELKSESIKVN